MSQVWENLLGLCRLPHRYAGSPEEERAAAWLLEKLKALGAKAQVQAFPTPLHTLYLGPALTGLLLAGLGALGLFWPEGKGLLAFLALPALLPLLGEVLLWPRGVPVSLEALLPKGRSQNVLGLFPKEGAKARLLLVAHYDTQWGSFLFAPSFIPFLPALFALGYLAFLAFPLLLLWGPAWALGLGVALAFLVGGAFALAWRLGGPVNGANDNASGVALALELARRLKEKPLERYELLLAFTGAEEVGLRGMAHLLRHPWAQGVGPVVNLDTLGRGEVGYLEADGTPLPLPYHPGLKALARDLGLKGHRHFLPTDGLLAQARGIPTLTFLAKEGGRIPNYHWPTDRPEALDPEALGRAAEVLEAFLRRLDLEPGDEGLGRGRV